MTQTPPLVHSSSNPPQTKTQDQDEKWVFAYGSLMWNPGFAPLDDRPARIHGLHRAMCVLSTIYRGTADQPGLVLGLDRGGSCLGRALQVAPDAWPQVKHYLDERELITGVYRPVWANARLSDGRIRRAYAYVVRRDHVQYWHGTTDQAVGLIGQGRGQAGSSRDYLAQTVAGLDQAGLSPGGLRRLLTQVDAALK